MLSAYTQLSTELGYIVWGINAYKTSFIITVQFLAKLQLPWTNIRLAMLDLKLFISR